jgi:hypothetical protein
MRRGSGIVPGNVGRANVHARTPRTPGDSACRFARPTLNTPIPATPPCWLVDGRRAAATFSGTLVPRGQPFRGNTGKARPPSHPACSWERRARERGASVAERADPGLTRAIRRIGPVQMVREPGDGVNVRGGREPAGCHPQTCLWVPSGAAHAGRGHGQTSLPVAPLWRWTGSSRSQAPAWERPRREAPASHWLPKPMTHPSIRLVGRSKLHAACLGPATCLHPLGFCSCDGAPGHGQEDERPPCPSFASSSLGTGRARSSRLASGSDGELRTRRVPEPERGHPKRNTVGEGAAGREKFSKECLTPWPGSATLRDVTATQPAQDSPSPVLRECPWPSHSM